jgi:hypothetical protein
MPACNHAELGIMGLLSGSISLSNRPPKCVASSESSGSGTVNALVTTTSKQPHIKFDLKRLLEQHLYAKPLQEVAFNLLLLPIVGRPGGSFLGALKKTDNLLAVLLIACPLHSMYKISQSLKAKVV